MLRAAVVSLLLLGVGSATAYPPPDGPVVAIDEHLEFTGQQLDVVMRAWSALREARDVPELRVMQSVRYLRGGESVTVTFVAPSESVVGQDGTLRIRVPLPTHQVVVRGQEVRVVPGS